MIKDPQPPLYSPPNITNASQGTDVIKVAESMTVGAYAFSRTCFLNTSSTGTTAVPAHPTYNPQLPPVLQGTTVNVTLTIQEQLVTIAPGIAYHAWTFNGTVPGPIIHVRQGQLVHTTGK